MNGSRVGLEEPGRSSDVADQGAFAGNAGDSLLALRAARGHARRAVYALLLLITLLMSGSVSDYLGRRRVILAGLAMTAGACGLFLAAHDAGLLFAARALQGAAVGTAVSALGASKASCHHRRVDRGHGPSSQE